MTTKASKSTKNYAGGMSCSEVAKALGMTRQNVRRVEKIALRKLYFALKEYQYDR